MINQKEFEEFGFEFSVTHKFWPKVDDKYEFDDRIFKCNDCGFFEVMAYDLFSPTNDGISIYYGNGLRIIYAPLIDLMYCRRGLSDGLPLFFTKIKSINDFGEELKKFKIDLNKWKVY